MEFHTFLPVPTNFVHVLGSPEIKIPKKIEKVEEEEEEEDRNRGGGGGGGG